MTNIKTSLKIFFRQALTKISIVSLIIFGIIVYNNDYMVSKDRKCVVLDKLTTTGGYKSSGNFYLILREERGIVFDLIVSPATFSQSKIGDTLYFSLRQQEIKQTPNENLIYFFGVIVFGVIGFVCLVSALLQFYVNK